MSPRHRIEGLYKSGELARQASTCLSRAELLARLGVTRDQYDAAIGTLRLNKVMVPGFIELKIAGLGRLVEPLPMTALVADAPVDDWSETETTKPAMPSIDVQLAERRERSELAATKTRLKAVLVELEQCRLELGVSREAEAARPNVTTIEQRETKSVTREATAVAIASDWHVEQCVDEDKVNGLNRFDLDIARARVSRFFDGYIWLTNYHRQAFTIRDALLGLIGDLITGYLREENLESNSLSPVQAIANLHIWITDGIRRYLDQTSVERMKIVALSGNHGRLTHKVRPSTREDNSIEWLLYVGLAREFANEPRVEFVLPHGVMTYVKVYERMLRFTHGDACKGGDGIGGIMIPILRKIAKWDAGIKACITNMGHFHQYHDLPFLTINSSLIGFDEYALEIGARPEDPSQAFYLIDSARGKVMSTRIWLTDSNQERKAA